MFAVIAALPGAAAQSPSGASAQVCVVTASKQPIAAAPILNSSGTALAVSDGSGCAAVPLQGSASFMPIRIALPGFAVASAEVRAGQTTKVVLRAYGDAQSVTVVADRGLAGVDDQATNVLVLDQQQLNAPPALTLDDQLHQVAGFQLYRRTSSWTANPTTEGVSLRGLGSTAASRTLVVTDEVPLNDAFGGWIHWDEIPTLAIEGVELECGGAADLYGSSAIGGVIDVVPVQPATPHVQFAADALGATENSAKGDMLMAAALPHANGLLAGSGLDTGGYIPTAPAARGTVDIPSNVAEESGRAEFRSPSRTDGDDLFVLGNVLNEARSNGTPDQTNGTRLWRYEGGGDANGKAGHGALRVFGDRETYRQSFSSTAPNRNSETLTRLQHVPTEEFGFALNGSRALPQNFIAGLGVDMRDIRATDSESPVAAGVVTATTDISARQREVGGYAEAIWQAHGWSVSGSVRVDSFRTFDGQSVTTKSRAIMPEPELDELVASPHAGVVRNLRHGISLTGTGFRAFRGPTMNELYRTGQVGQQLTEANNRLLAERATGFEFGAEFNSLRVHGRDWGHARASYFWTEVNRPISAVLLSQTATSQTLQRQNLGQIRSRGVSVEASTLDWHGFHASAGYQLAIATVTAFNTSSAVQKNLTGNWIPEVPRESFTSTLNYAAPHVANLHLIASYTGREFDDANNQFLLHAYPRFDASADRAIFTRWVQGLSLYGAAQNLANRAIDAGRTPVLTLAAPRLVEGGLRYTLSR